MRWIPKLVYNATEWTGTLPQKLWDTEEGVSDGDEDMSASGIVVGYWVRYDYIVNVTLRFTEDEYDALLALLELIMKDKATPISFWFDKDDNATEYPVYVESPKIGERIKPHRNAQSPWVRELELTLRSSDGTRLHQDAFVDA